MKYVAIKKMHSSEQKLKKSAKYLKKCCIKTWMSRMGFWGPVGPVALNLFWVMRPVLVCSSCQNKTPQAGWPKQRTFSFSWFWILEVQDQGASKFNSWWELSSYIADGHLLTVSSHDISFVCVGRKREREISGISSSYKDISPVGLGPQSYNII